MVHDKIETNIETPAVLTVREVATLLRIGRGTAYELVRSGQIPSLRLSRRIVIPRAALMGMLEKPNRAV